MSELNFFKGEIAPVKNRTKMPVTFRLARYPTGEEFIQAGYLTNEGFKNWIEWEKLELVDVNESGKAEGDHNE